MPGYSVKFPRPSSATAGRALLARCWHPQPGAFPRLETKPNGLCTRATLEFKFFFISGFHWPSKWLRWVEEGEDYRSLTGKIQSFRAPHPISSPRGGSVAEFPQLAAPREEGRFPHTGLVVGWTQEVRLNPGGEKAAPRGGTREAAGASAAGERRRGEMGGRVLSVMSFVPCPLVRRSLSLRLLSALFSSFPLVLKVGKAGF